VGAAATPAQALRRVVLSGSAFSRRQGGRRYCSSLRKEFWLRIAANARSPCGSQDQRYL